MKNEWIDNSLRRPEKEGVYLVTVTYEGWDRERKVPDGNRTGVEVTERMYCDAERYGFQGWVMDGEPEEGLVWTEETGSYPAEHVEAWMEMPEPFIRKTEGKEE